MNLRLNWEIILKGWLQLLNEELYELPAGWAWVKLGEVGTIVGGGTPRRDNPDFYKNGTIPWATPTDIDQKEILTIFATAEKITKEAVKESSAKVLPAGTVLFSSRASIGKIAIAGTELATNQGFANIIPSPALDSKYLAYGLRRFTKDIERLGSGTTYVEVAKSSLKEFYFPLAPLNEQRRIVARVEALLAESKTAREALVKVPVLLRRFRQSVLAKAFRGELTQRDPNDEPAQKLLERIRQERNKEKQTTLVENQKEPTAELPKLPETWVWTTIGELETFIGSGITPRGGKKVYVDSGILFIRSQNVHPDGLHLENIAHITPKIHEKMKRTKVHPNDVLLNITGASIGRSTYIPEKFGEANVNQHVCIIRTGWWIVPAYLSHFLNSTYGQDQIFATESGVTREGLNYAQVRSLWVPLAPVAEQKRVVAKIEEMFSIAKQIEGAVKKAREQAERIDQAILAKAFRGELVPQDPNDEPASVLLQRLKTKTKQQTTMQTKLTN